MMQCGSDHPFWQSIAKKDEWNLCNSAHIFRRLNQILLLAQGDQEYVSWVFFPLPQQPLMVTAGSYRMSSMTENIGQDIAFIRIRGNHNSLQRSSYCDLRNLIVYVLSYLDRV
jgi:hypothetical protein